MRCCPEQESWESRKFWIPPQDLILIAYSVNWPFVLEWVKALGTPAAALIAAIAGVRVSKRALQTFVSQKALERRINWYDDIAPSIRDYHSALSAWEQSPGFTERKALIDAHTGLAGRLDRALSTTGRIGYEACKKLMGAMGDAKREFAKERPDGAILTECAKVAALTALQLEHEIREDLGLGVMLPGLSKQNRLNG